MIDFNSSQEGKIDMKVKSRHELKASFLLIFKLKLKNSKILKMNFMQLEILLSTFRLSSGVLALYAGLGVRRYGLGLFKFVWLKGELWNGEALLSFLKPEKERLAFYKLLTGASFCKSVLFRFGKGDLAGFTGASGLM